MPKTRRIEQCVDPEVRAAGALPTGTVKATDERSESGETSARDRRCRQGRCRPECYVSAVDALLATGWLRPEKVQDWRRGRVPYLERVVVASLPKISTAMRIFRSWAESEGLRPSETVYVSWTRDRHRLRFSKSGDPNVERAYRTHWLPPKT